MSPSPPPSPLSLSSLVDDDDEDHCDDVQILKISVLHYMKHSLFPARGKLILSKKNLVFRSSSPMISGGASSSSARIITTWELDSIAIEKYRGKISEGIKIIPVESERRENDDFIFTMVHDRSYCIIHDAIAEAKLDRAMKKVRLETMAECNVSLSESLGATGDDATKRLPLLVQPLGFIFLIAIRIVSYLFRVFTGRRLRGPRDMHDALHGILTRTHQISWAASKLNLSEGRMRSIQKDIECIRESIAKIKQVHMRCNSTFMSCGSVAEASTTSRAFLETTGVSAAKILSVIAFVWFAIRRVVNMPFFRFDQLRLERHPTTVARAVQDANDMVDAVIEFAWKDARDTELSSKIDEEAERIRILLFNIKLCSATENAAR